ncbi:MAG: hypothetical protein CM1200mP41_34130 [Gammaproteobacteria bacterium]|nr:MAG: hypothetical protein CM1200mP41_34130 [Gammaproteobacteria bacterium]
MCNDVETSLVWSRRCTSAVRWSFLTVGVWWLVFSLPLFLWVDEPLPSGKRRRVDFARTFASLSHTFRHLSEYRAAWAFLFAYWLYIDGVDTIVVMAADYGKKLGFETTILIGAILMIQFIAFPAALVFGRLGERYGPKRGIWIAIVTYMGVTAYACIMTSPVELLVLAAIIGLVQGGNQSLSRSLFSLLIPQDKNAEFFGFYNVVGKAAAVNGPILVGFVTLTSGSPRMGIGPYPNPVRTCSDIFQAGLRNRVHIKVPNTTARALREQPSAVPGSQS